MSFNTGFNAAAAAIILYLTLNDAELSTKVATLSFWEALALFLLATSANAALFSGLRDLKRS